MLTLIKADIVIVMKRDGASNKRKLRTTWLKCARKQGWSVVVLIMELLIFVALYGLRV